MKKPIRHRRAAKIQRMALKLAIVASGRTHQRVAASAKIGAVKLSHIISGRRVPSPYERAQLAHVLGKPISELFPDLTPEAL